MKIRFSAGEPLGDGYNGSVDGLVISFRGDGDTQDLPDEVAKRLLQKFPARAGKSGFSEVAPPPPPPPPPPKATPKAAPKAAPKTTPARSATTARRSTRKKG